MTLRRTTLLAAFLASSGLMLAAPSAMSQSYPRVTGSGENLNIDYGPMGQGTLVGGGRVMVTMPDSMSVNIMHFDAIFSQTPRPGYVPLIVGSGESQEEIYVPAAMVQMLRNARANPHR